VIRRGALLFQEKQYMGHKIGRNDPCPCGSGKKYKKCCLAQDEEKLRSKIDNKPDIRRKNLYNNKDYDDLDAAPPVPYDQELSDDDNDDEHPGSKDIAAQYTCRQFERDIPEIGDDQQKLIEDWLLQYNKIPRKDDNSSSLIKDHLVRFLRKILSSPLKPATSSTATTTNLLPS
jgi:hypothetical protein